VIVINIDRIVDVRNPDRLKLVLRHRALNNPAAKNEIAVVREATGVVQKGVRRMCDEAATMVARADLKVTVRCGPTNVATVRAKHGQSALRIPPAVVPHPLRAAAPMIRIGRNSMSGSGTTMVRPGNPSRPLRTPTPTWMTTLMTISTTK